MSPIRVTVLNADGIAAEAIGTLAADVGILLTRCATSDALIAELPKGLDVVLASQVDSGSGSGIDALIAVRRRDPDAYLVLLANDVPRALAGMNRGYLDAVACAPFAADELARMVRRGGEMAAERRHERAHREDADALLAEVAGQRDMLTRDLEQRSLALARAEALLKQQQDELVRLETRGVVSQLVRGLAHELNNPLAAILGYAQRLRRMWAKDDDAVRRLDVILGEVDRCRGLVEQLRNLAAPIDEEVGPCQPERQLAQAESRLRDFGRAAPPCVIVGAIPAVLAAPQSLTRVFEHVLDNARLAGATRCWFSGIEDAGRVRLTIENDGATPDEDAVRNATRPFFTTMASQGRRGLGLAIATALIREQAGSLDLARRDGEPGAACHITLPARPITASLPTITAGPGAGETVLVVDDEPLVAELLLDALQENGFTGTVVGTVADALRELASGSVRAMLTDVRLPDGNGIDLVSRALAMRPELAGHIALITGGGDPGHHWAAGLGCEIPVLGKPFRLEQVGKLVRSIL
ncbi:MAG: hybrid sensor histidine kinase/response regulator [Planctomycetes bacterium]|nr:hybrid sensor histidine kinase/response regulator [Planctomycetota bacterium]